MHEQANEDAHEMQKTGGYNEANAVGKWIGAAGSSVPCAWPWKMAKLPTMVAPTQKGGRALVTTAQAREQRDLTAPIGSVKAFQAWQQASTIAS
jgi:hypothetical protein